MTPSRDLRIARIKNGSYVTYKMKMIYVYIRNVRWLQMIWDPRTYI